MTMAATGKQHSTRRPSVHAAGSGFIAMAFTGHAATQAAHETQSAGRISHGTGPAIARASVGQTATHVPELTHFVSSTTGISRIVFVHRGRPNHSFDGRRQQAGHQVFDHRLLQGREQNIPRPKVERQGR